MSFIRHSIQTVFVRVLALLLMFVVGIITARWLGPAGDGILALLILLKNLVFRFANLGFGSAFAFHLTRNPQSLRRFVQMAWGLSILLVAASVGILLLIWRRDFSPWRDLSPSVFYLSLPMVFFFFINNYFQRILSGQLRIAEMNIANLLLGVSNIILLLILVVGLKMGVFGGVIAFVLSDLCVFVYLLQRVYVNVPTTHEGLSENTSRSLVTLADLLQYGGWNYIAMLTNFLVEELPLILLKLLVGANNAVGWFVKARTLGRQSRLVALPISQVLFPYTAASDDRASVYRTNVLCRNSLVVMIALVAVVTVFIKPIILLLYGEAFLPAIRIFYCLAPGVIVWPAANFLAVHIAAMGRPKVISAIGMVTLVLAAAICFPAIRYAGAVGAGVSIAVIYLIQMLLRLLAYVRITDTGMTQVLIVQANDLKYYRKLLRAPWSRLNKIRKSS